MKGRCELKTCDCEDTIRRVLQVIRQVHRLTQDVDHTACPDEDAECPCYQAGLEEGERQPPGA